MNLFIIIGQQAVGKMTVGQELAEKTGAKLFYNHMTIDLVAKFFEYGSPEGDFLVNAYRTLLFDAVMKKKDYCGLIFTYVCDFNTAKGMSYLESVKKDFISYGHNVYLIELNASYETRIKRNASPNRLVYKEMKRDIVQSRAVFERFEKELRTVSYDGEVKWGNYIRIINENIDPTDVADMIINRFRININKD